MTLGEQLFNRENLLHWLEGQEFFIDLLNGNDAQSDDTKKLEFTTASAESLRQLAESELIKDYTGLIGDWVVMKDISDSLSKHLVLVGLSRIKVSLFEKAKPVTHVTIKDQNKDKNNNTVSLNFHTHNLGFSVKSNPALDGVSEFVDGRDNKVRQMLSFWCDKYKCFIQIRAGLGQPIIIDVRFVFRSPAILNYSNNPSIVKGGRVCLLKWITISKDGSEILCAHRWLGEKAYLK